MPEFICNTSPLQYLHQLGTLHLLGQLMKKVNVPGAVAQELDAGRVAGCDVPDLTRIPWITLIDPVNAPALPLAADLGSGEASVLALALELSDPVVILDDAVARRAAQLLGIPLTGTLGVLIDAKRHGLIPAVAPRLAELDRLHFRVSAGTRLAVLAIAGEVGGSVGR